LIQAQRELSDKDFAIFNAELQRQARSAIVAYVLWFFLGSMGVHNFYMGKILWGLLYIGLMIIGWGLTIGGSDDSSVRAGAGALLILAALLLWDLFTIPLQLKKRQECIGQDLLRKLR
jgi:hypothetical protein